MARGAGLAALGALTLVAVAARAADVHPDVPRRLAETGAPVKVWILFDDKLPGATAAEREAVVATARAALPERVLQRRALRGTAVPLVGERDLPVAASYRAAVVGTGAVIHQESRWLDALSATVDTAQLAAVAALPGVREVRLVSHSVRPPLHATPVAPPSPTADGGFYGEAQDQHELINLPPLHAAGHDGDGVIIGVLDTGFVTTHDAFNDPSHPLQVLAAYDFLNDDSNVGIEPGDDPDQHFHGTFILGELGAYLPGVLVGAAWKAQYILCKTEDAVNEFPAEEDSYVAGLEFAEQLGADVCTSSLGYIQWYVPDDLDGQTAVTTLAVNVATSLGVVCCTAAGNEGHDLVPGTNHLMAPGDAFEVLTVGAVEPTWEFASFTSDGPTADGRLKPELLVMGTQVMSVWPYDDFQLAEAAGTSTSTPEMAGVVACLLEAKPDSSVAGIRQRLIASGTYFGSPLPDPLSIYGYGVPNCANALALAGSWQTVGAGLAGSAGVPLLAGSGSLVAGDQVSLTVTKGKPGGAAFLIVGFAAVNAPFKGGVLVPAVNLLVGPLALNASGAVTLAGPWVSGLPASTNLWLQAWIPDAAAVHGFAASAALKATTP